MNTPVNPFQGATVLTDTQFAALDAAAISAFTVGTFIIVQSHTDGSFLTLRCKVQTGSAGSTIATITVS